MPSFVEDAICVRHWDWSETSQTVSLFTRGRGLLRGLAKGAKREKGSFSGGFEILTRGELGAIIKPSGGLATLTSWDLRETYPGFRRSLRAHYAGLYVVDLIQHMLTEEDPHPGLYDRTAEALREMQAAEAPRLARALVVFQLALLDETGYRPELHGDVRSGAELEPAGLYGFSPDLGGLVPDPGAEGGGYAWRVRGETVELLRRLQADPGAAEGAPEALWRANRLLAAYIRAKLGEEPRSMRSLLAATPRDEGNGFQRGAPE